MLHDGELAQVVERGGTLPPRCYCDPVFFQWEVETLFRGGWHCVGRADRLANAGDYQALEITGVPLFLLRGDDGELRCLSNVCRHRAMPLLQGRGRCDLIRCPFHGWSYRPDGTLAGAPTMNRQTGFDKREFALAQVRLQTLDGFVFVNLDGQASPLSMTGFAGLHAPYALHDLRVTRRKRFAVACNWKLFLQVFMEYYHLEHVHAATFAQTAYQAPEPGDETFADSFVSVFGLHHGTGAVLQDPATRTFDPIPTLDDRLSRGTRYTHVFPGLAFAAARDCLWFFECYPVSPGESVFYLNSCFPAATLARCDFDKIVASYYARWDTALAEDIEMLERQQRGMASPLARPGRSSHLESAVTQFERWIAASALAPERQRGRTTPGV